MPSGKHHYTITGKVLPIHELIGLSVSVKESKDAKKLGISGMIVDETQRTFVIENANGNEIILPKNESIFEFTLGDELVSLKGKTLLYTPVERLKAQWGN